MASEPEAYSNEPVLAEAPTRELDAKSRGLGNLARHPRHLTGLQQLVALILLGFSLLLSLLILLGLAALGAAR